jgi:acyl-CoA dehydrogenase
MDDDLRMFRSTVRKFVQTEFVPQQARWREQHRPDAEAWMKAGETGILLSRARGSRRGRGTSPEAIVVERRPGGRRCVLHQNSVILHPLYAR